jgi:toxin YoeB
MKIIFSPGAWEDYLHWQNTDLKIVGRINTLIMETRRNPMSGIGKPEPLRHSLAGSWSRRITAEHRMVYKIEGGNLLLVQLRYHY